MERYEGGYYDNCKVNEAPKHNRIIKVIIFLLIFIIGIGVIYIKNPDLLRFWQKVTLTIPAELMDLGNAESSKNFSDTIKTGKAVVKDNGDIEVTLNWIEYMQYKKDIKQAIIESIDEINNDSSAKEVIRKIEVDNNLISAKIYMNDSQNIFSEFIVSIYAIAVSYELQIYDSISMTDNNITIYIYDFNNTLIGTMDEKALQEWADSMNSDTTENSDIAIDNDVFDNSETNDKYWDTSENSSSEQEYTVFELGETAEFATMNVTVTKSYATDTISGTLGTTTAQEGTMFIVVNIKAENTTKSMLSTSMDFMLVDNQNRQYAPDTDDTWYLDNADYYPDLQPNIPKEINILYNVPNDVTDAVILGSHAQTGEIYALKIK